MCIRLSAQTSEQLGVNDNEWKSDLTDEKENYVTDNNQKESEPVGGDGIIVKTLIKRDKFDTVNDSEGTETPVISLNRKSIDATVVRGKRITYPVTIENSGISTLYWEISVQGLSGISYRLNKYPLSEDFIPESKIIKDQNKDIVSRVDAKGKQNENYVQNLEIKEGKRSVIVQNKNSMEGNNVKEFYLTLQDNNTKSFESVNDNQMLSNQISKTDLKTLNRLEPEMFLKYYHFLECGYSTFEPRDEVVEISTDNGKHWKQILQLGDQSYVVDAKCFNPTEFLETYNNRIKNYRGSKLTSLEEYLAEVQKKSNWLSIQPSFGKIPANTSMEIEVSFDAASLESGSFNPNIILETKGSNMMEINIPIHLTVVSRMKEMGNSQSNQLSKTEKSDQFGEEQIEDESKKIPDEYALLQNYPNPFNPRTSIRYAVSSVQFISLKVYDILGNEVATIVNEEKAVGYYEIEFNASFLANGIYFYRLQAGSFTETNKMVLMK
jgi:hypothetical protein